MPAVEEDGDKFPLVRPREVIFTLLYSIPHKSPGIFTTVLLKAI